MDALRRCQQITASHKANIESLEQRQLTRKERRAQDKVARGLAALGTKIQEAQRLAQQSMRLNMKTPARGADRLKEKEQVRRSRMRIEAESIAELAELSRSDNPIGKSARRLLTERDGLIATMTNGAKGSVNPETRAMARRISRNRRLDRKATEEATARDTADEQVTEVEEEKQQESKGILGRIGLT